MFINDIWDSSPKTPFFIIFWNLNYKNFWRISPVEYPMVWNHSLTERFRFCFSSLDGSAFASGDSFACMSHVFFGSHCFWDITFRFHFNSRCSLIFHPLELFKLVLIVKIGERKKGCSIVKNNDFSTIGKLTVFSISG